MLRLKQEFAGFGNRGLSDRILISVPPRYGLDFEHLSFRLKVWNELKEKEFEPDVIAIDPLNSIARDDRMGDYRASFDSVRDFAAGFKKDVAIVIVAHTRKPRFDDQAKGRRLLHEFSGSYILTSVPRCAFIMQHASADPEDDRIVWSCCKNNDGACGAPSAWRRRDGLFVPIEDFDLDAFEAASQPRRTVTADDIRAVLADKAMTRKEAVKELMNLTGLKHSACYAALNPHVRFRDILEETDGLLRLKPQSN